MNAADAGRTRSNSKEQRTLGQIEEMCRHTAVQVKRMRQRQEQADELRTAFRQRAGPSGTDAMRTD